MLNNFKIFLSGGITGLDTKECKKWRDCLQSRFYGVFGLNNNVTVNQMRHFNPNKETSDTLEKEAMMYNLYHVRTADIIIVNLDKINSVGTAQELMLAYELHKPIIGFIQEDKVSKIHPWIQMEVGKLFTYKYNKYYTEATDEETPDCLEWTLEGIVDYVKNHYYTS